MKYKTCNIHHLRRRDFRFCYDHQMPSDYTLGGPATRLVGCGELNFTDQILLANRVGQLDNATVKLTVKWSTTAMMG